MTSSAGQINEIATVISGFAFKSKDWQTSGNPVVKIRNINDGVVNLEGCSFVSNEVALKANRFWAQNGDVVISLTGATLAEVARFGETQRALINQRVGYVQAHHSDDLNYIYYLLRFYWNEIRELGSGTAQSNVAPRDIMELSVPIISAKLRLVAGNILAALDDKIRLNTELTQTLEAIAQSIFKSWFIDFDPVHAKSRGEKPEGMSDEAAALFPDSFEESELGMIPKGWQIKPLGGVITPKKGKSITKSICVEGDVPVVGGGLHPAYFHNQANELEPVVTVSASGANAGYVRLYQENIWASDCSVVSTEVSKYVYYWYLFLSTNQSRIYSMQQGAALPT